MRTRHVFFIATVCLALTTLLGCGTDTAELPPEVVAPLIAETDTEVAPEEAVTPSPAAQVAPNPQKKQSAYRAPFPSRSELFSPPAGARRVARRQGGGDFQESVELMGFAEIEGPHVVLAIDGVVTPIALGGEQLGVQVISIDPPIAVLQRGRTRWTASLE